MKRMFERSITQGQVAEVIRDGAVIEDYPDDSPFPSCLLFAAVEGRALHVVIARRPDDGRCLVVTAYEPDPVVWLDDWRRRRHP